MVPLYNYVGVWSRHSCRLQTTCPETKHAERRERNGRVSPSNYLDPPVVQCSVARQQMLNHPPEEYAEAFDDKHHHGNDQVSKFTAFI